MSVQQRYNQMRRDGLSHNLAEMFALQAPPQIGGTDAIFNEGHCNGSQFEGQEHIGDMYRTEAEAAGVDTKGKVYLGGLAAYPGDPAAWVSGRGDVKRVVESRGWGCQGAVKVKAQEPLRAEPDVRLGEDIIQSQVDKVMKHVPKKKRPYVDTADLRDQVIDRMAPPKSWGNYDE